MEKKKTEVDKMIKTPSQRLRAVLYLVWEQFEAPSAFQIFYDKTMERIIEQFSKRIEKKGGK